MGIPGAAVEALTTTAMADATTAMAMVTMMTMMTEIGVAVRARGGPLGRRGASFSALLGKGGPDPTPKRPSYGKKDHPFRKKASQTPPGTSLLREKGSPL